jgi:hypothetical protein
MLSYAARDLDRASSVAAAFGRALVDVWWDRKVAPGARWRHEIEQALDGASCVVVLWTKVSLASAWVVDEATEAADRGMLVPVVLDGGIQAPLGLRGLQNIDLSDWSGDDGHGGWRQLLAEVRRRLTITAPTPATDPSPPVPDADPVDAALRSPPTSIVASGAIAMDGGTVNVSGGRAAGRDIVGGDRG